MGKSKRVKRWFHEHTSWLWCCEWGPWEKPYPKEGGCLDMRYYIVAWSHRHKRQCVWCGIWDDAPCHEDGRTIRV